MRLQESDILHSDCHCGNTTIAITRLDAVYIAQVFEIAGMLAFARPTHTHIYSHKVGKEKRFYFGITFKRFFVLPFCSYRQSSRESRVCVCVYIRIPIKCESQQ